MIMPILRLLVCVLVSCGVLHGFPIGNQQGGNPVRRGAQVTSTDTRRVTLYDGMVSFVPPEGFSRLSEQAIATKFPEAKGPGIVYGNSRATVSIAITSPPQRMLRAEQLPAFKTFMESFIEKEKRDVQWSRKEFVEINAQRWIHFEFLSLAVDTRIHNEMYLTSVDERMLLFNFNATVEEYAGYKDALERSKDSIQIKESL